MRARLRRRRALRRWQGSSQGRQRRRPSPLLTSPLCPAARPCAARRDGRPGAREGLGRVKPSDTTKAHSCARSGATLARSLVCWHDGTHLCASASDCVRPRTLCCCSSYLCAAPRRVIGWGRSPALAGAGRTYVTAEVGAAACLVAAAGFRCGARARGAGRCHRGGRGRRAPGERGARVLRHEEADSGAWGGGCGVIAPHRPLKAHARSKERSGEPRSKKGDRCHCRRSSLVSLQPVPTIAPHPHSFPSLTAIGRAAER